MIFLPIYVHFGILGQVWCLIVSIPDLCTLTYFNGQTFSSVFQQFSFTSKFLWLKMQKSTFCKKIGFESSFFIKLTFRWLQTGLSDRKNTKPLKLCMMDFLRNFKMLQFFKIFRDF